MKNTEFSTLPVGGVPGGEAFLVSFERHTFLIECGFSFSADALVDRLRAALGGRRLDFVLLTHSHYDHVGGLPAVKEAFPEALVCASEAAAQIFAKESARALMREMNASAAAYTGMPEGPDRTAGLRVDRVLADGDVIESDGLHVKAIATPGHTRCCMSYHFEEADLLVASESSGIPFGDTYRASFISSYRQALSSIDRLAALTPRHVLTPHHGMLTGMQATEFPERARRAAEDTAAFVLSLARAGMPEDDLYEAYKERYYDGLIKASGLQPEKAFIVNAHASIPRLLRELLPEA
ncbi:MAG: MBL fold metallo-hydrolase [Clostridiales Family XIII bacterium]|jgi:glyoxylase-like metal-dependent hydrolase (beta-lactamase superfamily II)|nr:MBL fold metallo-hydrolase [Clostridiales Family XIII bacterium]